MARRERQAAEETAGQVDSETVEGLDGETVMEGTDSRESPGRTKVTLTLSHETAWRLRVKSQMEGIAPGQLVEPLIAPFLKGDRLPYEKYRRKLLGRGKGPEDVSAA